MKRYEELQPVLVCPEGVAGLEMRALDVFAEEIGLHTGLSLTVSPIPMPGMSNVVLLTREKMRALCPDAARELDSLAAPGPEGFRLMFRREAGRLSLYGEGADARGVFYAMGKLLRLLRLKQGVIAADALFTGCSSTPEYPLRGHQLAYRDKQNTLPCWTEKEFDRYIRDLALFGSNAIELLPPRTDDNLYSRKMKRDPFEMMVALERIVHSYGMDVWLWYPNMGRDYSDPTVMEAEMAERHRVFSALGSIEGMLVPAGDPGELAPDELFPVTERCADILHRYHPDCKVYLAPQSFAPQPGWYDAFYRHVDEQPAWLYGICFAPWEQQTIEEMRDRLPACYKDRIRHYPDITHNFGCQFAMPHWDNAFAIIEGRECNNTRPRAMKTIHNRHAPLTIGSITYSEGIHDDLNKFVWGQQDWDSAQPAEATVREYVRYFIDPDLEDELTEALMALEKNWDDDGPIERNGQVEATYALWMDLESRAGDALRENYRYQLGLLRALGDAYAQGKQRYDNRLEDECRQVLERAGSLGADEAMRQAAAILRRGVNEPCNPRLRARLQQMADHLHLLCGIKLTSFRHGGQSWGRGAWIDMLDTSLNDSQYFLTGFKRIRALATEEEKQAALQAMLHRTDPGEGGIYIDLGSPESRKLLHQAHPWPEDPGLLRTASTFVDASALRVIHDDTGTWREQPIPRQMLSRAATYYDVPLTVTIPGLDPDASYRLRVGHMPQRRAAPMQLRTGDGTVLDDHVDTTRGQMWFEYDLPPASYADGSLTLTWQALEIAGGSSVNELFILRRGVAAKN